MKTYTNFNLIKGLLSVMLTLKKHIALFKKLFSVTKIIVYNLKLFLEIQVCIEQLFELLLAIVLQEKWMTSFLTAVSNLIFYACSQDWNVLSPGNLIQ